MEKELNAFVNYWLEFGFLTGTNVTTFKNKYNQISESYNKSNSLKDEYSYVSSIHFQEKVSQSIVEFWNSWTDDRKKLLSLSWISKFQSVKQNAVNKGWVSWVKIYSKHEKRNSIIKNVLMKWKKVLSKNCKTRDRNRNSNDMVSRNSSSSNGLNTNGNEYDINYKKNYRNGHNNCNSNNKSTSRDNTKVPVLSSSQYRSSNVVLPVDRYTKKNHHNYKSYIRNIKVNNHRRKSKNNSDTKGITSKSREKILDTTVKIKEQEELKYCTFHPDIKNTFDYYNTFYKGQRMKKSDSTGNMTAYERLYNFSKCYKEKKEILIAEKKMRESKELTFKPIRYSKSPKHKTIENDFNERLKNFDEKRRKI